MRVFIAGATGVIGRRLVPSLVSQGHHVTALARTSADATRLTEQGADIARADVFDAAALSAAVRSAAPEAVVHQLTALSAGSSAENAEMRRTGTRNLVDAAVAAGARRIVAQSIAWAYAPGELPATEDVPLDLGADEPRRTTVTGVVALEEAVRALPEWVVLRYGTLYGPGTWYAPDGPVAGKARAGELPEDAAVSSFVHLDDAVSAAAAALAWPTGAVNICDDEPAAASAWVPAFRAAVTPPDAPPTRPTPPAPAAPRPADPRPGWARGADNTYARRELGWKPQHPSWREGFTTL